MARHNATAIFLVTLATTVTPAGAQPQMIATVRGEVRAQLTDGRLIPGSLIAVSIAPSASAKVEQPRSTITGWDGFYYFQDVQPGTYTLTVNQKEKPPQTFRVDLRQVPSTDVPPIILSARLRDHRLAYGNAVRAMDLEDWSGAVHILQQLLTLRPETATTRMELIQTQGRYSDLYRPHYYLGLALQKLGDCDGALREWKSEESLGELKSTHRQAIEEGRRACSRGQK
jgi:hypothetical protein